MLTPRGETLAATRWMDRPPEWVIAVAVYCVREDSACTDTATLRSVEYCGTVLTSSVGSYSPETQAASSISIFSAEAPRSGYAMRRRSTCTLFRDQV
jgi:hypothetical protein